MKALIKVLVALVIVLVVGVVAAFLARNVIATALVPGVASTVLGVKVELGAAEVGLSPPSARLTDLDIGNPPAYTAPYSLKLGDVNVQVAADGVSASKIVVDSVALDKLGIWFIQNGDSNNISDIVANLSKGGDSSEPAASGDAGQVEIVIKKMTLTNLEVHATVAGADMPVIVVDRIELANITSKGKASDLTSQLTREIFEVTMKATIDACGKQLPAAITANVGKSLEGAGVAIGQATAAMGEAAKKAVDEATKGIGEATKGIGDLFGGEKSK